MHTLHWFAVEAEDKEEAFALVQSRLINDEGEKFVEWSDWHVVGGGRWSDSQYEDSSALVLSYADSPAEFKERVKTISKFRIEELNRYLKHLDFDKLQSDIVDYISNDCILPDELRFGGFNSYYFKKVGEMLQDYYTCDSYYYDLVEYTAHLGYIQERLDNPDISMRQYLVPVDFHF